MPDCQKKNIRGTSFNSDGSTNMSDERYSRTASGVLGVHRRSMLYNPLLLNCTELGKSKCRGYNKKFKGGLVVYGKSEQRDADAIRAVFNWNASPSKTNSNKQNIVPKIDKSGPSSSSSSDKCSTSRSEMSLKDIMEYKFQREWMEKRLQKREVSDAKSCPNMPNMYRDTLTSSLRYQLASSSSSSSSPLHLTGDRKHVWKMPKFENVRARVQTYRRPGD